MDVKDCERALGVPIRDLYHIRRPVIIYAIDEGDVLAHLLADLCRIGGESGLILPIPTADGPAVLGQCVHRSVVQGRKVEKHKVPCSSLPEGVDLIIDAVDVVQDRQVQPVVCEEC